MRPLWFVHLIQHFFPDRFKIAQWTKQSRLIRMVVDYFLFHGDQLYYLPKDQVAADLIHPVEIKPASSTPVLENVRIGIHEAVDTDTSIGLPSTIVKKFIHEARYIMLMDQCLCRGTMQCKDYPIEIGCIFMGEAVLGIDPRLGHLATKEEALRRVELAQEYGLVHLIGKNKIDTQWMGVHPGDHLLTVCSCCPCCCLYKVLPDLDESIAKKIEKMPGLEIWIDEDECIGCGACTDAAVCMTGNLQILDGRAIMGDCCVGCGRCYEVCQEHAIKMKITNEDYIQETFQRIQSRVNVQ